MAAADLEKFAPRQKYFELDYLKALLRLLPMGSIWVTLLNAIGSPTVGNTFVTLFSCLAAELARLEVRCMALFREQVPGMSSEMLSDWERVAGIPEIGGSLALTTAERQNIVHAKLYSDEGFGLTEAYYVNYAALLGYGIRFYYDESDPFYVAPVGVDLLDIGSRMGDRLNASASISYIIVKVIGGLTGTENLQAAIEYRKPAHILLNWQELLFNRLIIYSMGTYTFADVGIGALTAGAATDSATYAEDHANLLAQYGMKEMVTICSDDSTEKRPTNVAYSAGPTTLSSFDGFDDTWAFYSPATEAGGFYARNITQGVTYNLSTEYPASASTFAGMKGILSGCFDMSGTPVLSWESAVDTISVWRSIEGLGTWEGYSPLAFCNEAFIPVSNPDNLLTDTIILYLEDLNGYTSEWNYSSVYTAVDQIEYDTRYSRTVKARFQRNNFDTAYTLFTTDFDIAYIENAWFDGDPDDFVIPDDIGREYCLYVSVRDTNKVRHTVKSAPFYFSNVYPVTLDAENAGMTAVIESGALFETLVEDSFHAETSAMSAAISSGVLLNMEAKYDGSESPELMGITSTISSGVLFDQTIVATQQTETSALSSAINSGVLFEASVVDSMKTETAALTAAISSGALTTP